MDGIKTTTEQPPGEPGPWQNGFLPTHTIPVHYNLSLSPDFYYDGNTYTGVVDIDIHVTEATQYLILHYKMMNITGTSVFDKISGMYALPEIKEGKHCSCVKYKAEINVWYLIRKSKQVLYIRGVVA